MFNPRISAAAAQLNSRTHSLLANSPIQPRSLVKWISGMTANGSCRLRTTWLRMISL